MSYGVALRNGVPFTLGTIAALCVNATSQWSPLALWPNGVDSPGMWSSPSTLPASFNDSTGTTPVATPGTVADYANPVGLALDIRAGATTVSDPGNHMLQSTSAARPLESARVNLLTYTEDFTHAPWTANSYGSGTITLTQNYALAPDGSMTACRLQATAPTASDDGGLLRYGVINGAVIRSYWAKSNTGSNQKIVVRVGFATVTVTSEWQQITYSANELVQMFDSGVYRYGGAFDSDATCDILIWHPQLEFGTTATDYQSVPTDGSTYATDFPIFQKYDGVDDGMATASFAAGTLINGMDCMIAVRRDSGVVGIAGLSDGPINNAFFGFFHDANNTDPHFGTCGTPTTWVDGVQLAGGTATTRATLYNALTPGEWHVFELRGLDLSAWTATAFSSFSGANWRLNGARGDIMLYPSTASTVDKDNARQYLADKYGVTLP